MHKGQSKNNMYFFHSLKIFFICFLLVGRTAIAEDSIVDHIKYPRYQVEIIVFSNSHQSAATPNQESFAASPGELNKNHGSEFDNTLTSVKFLSNEYNKIKKKANYKIILHSATQYNLLPSQRNKKFLINLGSKVSETENPDLTEDFRGTLTITQVRNTFNIAFDGIFSKFRLTKSAKIKPKEIYYFDHPMFGALVTMVEIKDK